MASNFERSRLLYDQRRYDLAIQELQQALAINPEDASCHRLLALCFAQQKHDDAAIAQIDQAIHLSPNHAGGHYIKAGILRDQGKLVAARTAIAEALRLDPEDADSYARLAAIQYEQNQTKVALASAEQGLQLNAEHLGCMNLRLLALTQLGQLPKAEAGVQSVLAALLQITPLLMQFMAGSCCVRVVFLLPLIVSEQRSGSSLTLNGQGKDWWKR